MPRRLAMFIFFVVSLASAFAGEVRSAYKVLAPISHGNLTIYPVVASSTHDTSEFLTLDEGLRSGDVVVTEAGRIQPLMRRGARPIPSSGGEVNRLVLVNNSHRPLLLLAGEIVTGGKQDRVIGKDRIVPAQSDPIDLGVFCVEPGRWTGASGSFDGLSSQMAQPTVRNKAMVAQNQQAVWDSVRSAQDVVVGGPLSAPAAAEIHGTTSYARVMENAEVKKQVDEIAAPVRRDYQSLIHELRARNAVGVVVAVNGRIIWADVFASTSLLEKYWPKLVRSYAAEAYIVRTSSYAKPDMRAARDFLDNLDGRRQVSEVEPGVFRQTEISGDGFKVFALTSLLPKTGFDLHLAKAVE